MGVANGNKISSGTSHKGCIALARPCATFTCCMIYNQIQAIVTSFSNDIDATGEFFWSICDLAVDPDITKNLVNETLGK